jgi:acetolactate synthase-1/2/3 large subunit
MERAFDLARSGVPGPVFVEIPIDLLYRESLVRSWYLKDAGVENPTTLAGKALKLYLEGHLYRLFHAPSLPLPARLPELPDMAAQVSSGLNLPSQVRKTARLLAEAQRPVLLVGSQALVNCQSPERLARAVEKLGVPTYLGGMARGLLGRQHALQYRHARGKALKEADVVLVAGFPFDFRLSYGRAIGRRATVVSANLSGRDLFKNRRPEVALNMHPGDFLEQLAEVSGALPPRPEWTQTLRARESARDAEISQKAAEPSSRINPLHFFVRMEAQMADDALLVVDGGDFVGTASYILRPRGPLSWLDPGVFGTLGVGGGFAAGAALARPGKEVWLVYGDGSAAYSLAEFDTFCRHGLAPIAVVGNDGCWSQIAREQVEMLGDDVGTVLERSPYHVVAEGYGGKGLLLTDPAQIDATLEEAKRLARAGKPSCINIHIEKTDFRKGSISV